MRKNVVDKRGTTNCVYMIANCTIIKDDDEVARYEVLIMMMLLTYLFWDMEEVKEDVKCDKILDKGALCTIPIYDSNHKKKKKKKKKNNNNNNHNHNNRNNNNNNNL